MKLKFDRLEQTAYWKSRAKSLHSDIQIADINSVKHICLIPFYLMACHNVKLLEEFHFCEMHKQFELYRTRMEWIQSQFIK
jgi:hypothetical protein